MQTSSFLYLCFIALVFVINFLFPIKFRWIWLLFTSYFFCICVDLRFGIVLLTVTLISYICAILIGRIEKRKSKKYWLILGILLIVGILFIFKYLNFSLGILERLSKIFGLPGNFVGIKIFIPLGISFYTLQAISYLIDIYNDVILPEKNPGRFALYMAFFPKFLSGPIERDGHLLPQIREPKPFEYSRLIDGLTRIGWGFFKKLVIADRLGVIVNTLFLSPDNFASPVTILAVFSFSIQIYIDFSAYCDIAIGSARLLGIDLVENFKLPYFAKSVTEFWRRWHISFTSWLRDYIFTPLNFATRRKRSKIIQYVNILIVFLVSGIWHGANFTFIIWGLIHGFYQIIEAATQNIRNAVPKKTTIECSSFVHQFLQGIRTFILVTFAWIFFRADNLNFAFKIIKTIFTLKGFTLSASWDLTQLGLGPINLWIMLFSLVVFIIVEIIHQKHDLLLGIRSLRLPLRWIIYYSLIFGIILFGYFGAYKPESFIYALF